MLTLRQRLCDWFTNHLKGTKDAEVAKLHKALLNITARMLIQRNHSTEITPIAQRLRAEDPSLDPLVAHNLATTEHIKILDTERKEEFKKFEDITEEIKYSGQVDYADQSHLQAATRVSKKDVQPSTCLE
ncbi:hypothetical protein FRC08_000706 [Ceratobasidium sp. 394]|nr:hypothetical protein FRC08_000706 [Ceratobasidium sp. 394]